MMQGCLNMIDGILNMIDGSLNMINGSLNMIDGPTNILESSDHGAQNIICHMARFTDQWYLKCQSVWGCIRMWRTVLLQYSIQYFIFPIIKHKEYNIHVMSCATVKEEFNYTVNYCYTCFTMRWDSKKNRAYLLGLPL